MKSASAKTADREFESLPLCQYPGIVRKKTTPITEREIEDIVVAQADDDAAWGRSVHAKKSKPTNVPLPAPVATRAAFLARLHREKSVDAWIERIIRDRLDFEEAAFADVKRELASR